MDAVDRISSIQKRKSMLRIVRMMVYKEHGGKIKIWIAGIIYLNLDWAPFSKNKLPKRLN